MTPDPRHPDLLSLKADHTPRAIARRLRHGHRPRFYLKDFVYGALDGTVTTFAVVAGVAGAKLSAGIVVVLGLANLVGDGFSMAVGNYQGTKAEEELRQLHRRIEADHIDRYPDGEREEVRQIFAAKGFDGEDLERAVTQITADRERWIDTMLTDELGLALEGPDPVKAAWTTFVSFFFVGALPLLAFIYQIAAPQTARLADPFVISSAMTGLAFFVIGAIKSRFVSGRWWTSGLETLLMGGVAAALAYAVGALLRGLVDTA